MDKETQKQDMKADVTKTENGVDINISKNNIDDLNLIIVAGYNENGILTDIKFADSDNVTIENTELKSIKVFCLENLETLKPITTSIYKELV